MILYKQRNLMDIMLTCPYGGKNLNVKTPHLLKTQKQKLNVKLAMERSLRLQKNNLVSRQLHATDMQIPNNYR